MRSRLGNAIVAVLLIFSVGGQWTLLQSVAWVSMIADFSKTAPLSVAIQKTFDGEHPCKICKVVRHGKESEEKQDAIKSKIKSEHWLAERKVAFELAPAPEKISTEHLLFFQSRGQSPPTPPPRRA